MTHHLFLSHLEQITCLTDAWWLNFPCLLWLDHANHKSNLKMSSSLDSHPACCILPVMLLCLCSSVPEIFHSKPFTNLFLPCFIQPYLFLVSSHQPVFSMIRVVLLTQQPLPHPYFTPSHPQWKEMTAILVVFCCCCIDFLIYFLLTITANNNFFNGATALNLVIFVKQP